MITTRPTETGPAEQKGAAPRTQPRRTPSWKRQTAIVARWLHIYVSMVSFAIVLFFAATGLTLNHAEMFNYQARTTVIKGKVDPRWISRVVDKLAVVEYLRKTNDVKSALSDFRVDDSQCSVSFKGPGYTADAFIDRPAGTYELTVVRSGIVAVMNDLHKGRDTGPVWSKVIDVSAGLMTLISLSGLVLIFFLQKKRMSGLIAVGIGAALCLLVYYIWVP